MNGWDRFDSLLARLEQFLIALLLSTTMLVAFLQIVLRNFFATGLAWGDALIRYLVVWVAFLGAALAVREGKHINIEILAQWLPPAAGRPVRLTSDFFSALICGLLAVAAWKFVRLEALMGGSAFFGVPGWVPQAIIPLSFGIMALRFGFKFAGEFPAALHRGNGASRPDKGGAGERR